MTKVSAVPKTTFFFNKHSQGKEQEQDDEEEEEEYNMASHLAEDPVRPGPQVGLVFVAKDSHADLFTKVRGWLFRDAGLR